MSKNSNKTYFCFLLEEKGAEELIDLIAGMQSKRMDEQRVELPHLPGLVPPPGQSFPVAKSTEGSEDFFEMLMRCQVLITNLTIRHSILICSFELIFLQLFIQNMSLIFHSWV
jgi:hypothetical protein